jgi:hypothetical protein
MKINRRMIMIKTKEPKQERKKERKKGKKLNFIIVIIIFKYFYLKEN